MLEYLQNPFILRAIIAIVLISMVTATIGSFTVFRGLSFLLAGIAHAAMAGAAFAIFISYYGLIPHFHPLLGSLIFGLIMIIAVGLFKMDIGGESSDVAIGIAFAMSMSLAVLFISLIREYAVQAWGLIVGDLLLLTTFDILLLIIVTAIIVFLTMIFYKEFLFISFDIEGAEALGLRIVFYNYLMLILIALAVVVLLKGVGAILVYALMIIPAAAANNVARKVSDVFIFAFIFSLMSGFLGLVIALYIDVAPSALAGLIALAIYITTLKARR